MKLVLPRFPFLTFFALLASFNVLAQTSTWTGNTSSAWNDASNWSPSGVPSATDDVIIANTATQPTISIATAVARSMVIESSSTLTISSMGILTINNAATTTSAALYSEGIIENNGKLILDNLSASGEKGLYNYGIFNNNNGGEVKIDRSTQKGLINDGTFTNSGKVIIGGTASVGAIGLSNSGTFNNNACGSLLVIRGSYDNQSNATATNNGLVQIENNLENAGMFGNNAVLKYGSVSTTPFGLAFNATTAIRVNNSQEPIFGYGPFTYDGTVNGIFTDDVGTLTAGTFVAPNNFTPSNTLPVGSQTLYAKITPNGGTCSFAVPFTYIKALPSEMNVFSNGNSISDDDASPSTTDNTDFGSQSFANGSISKTFTIENTGEGNLNLTGDPKVVIGGNHASDFTVTTQPASPLEAPAPDVRSISSVGSSTIFIVDFDPSSIGLREATISIANNDSDENPYNFSIRGTGTISASDVCTQEGTSTDLMTWTGLKNANWDDACNWSPVGIPTVTNDVIIAPTSTQPTISIATAVAKSVEVEASATLTIASTGVLTLNDKRTIATKPTTFYNAGTVDNSGQIIIGNAAYLGEIGLFNIATFINKTGAELYIDNCYGKAISNSATANFTNAGKMTLGSIAAVGEAGVYNEGIFNNNVGGEIKTDNSWGRGIYNENAATFTNVAKVIIGSITSAGDEGIKNQGAFTNQLGGDIIIDRSNVKAIQNYQGTFTNSAKITIGATASAGTWGIENRAGFEASAIFNNNSGGEIIIDNTTQFGIENTQELAVFTNEAKITIGASTSVGNNGIYNDNSAAFNNNVGGDISIDNSTSTGIYNASQNFTNNAKITIGAITSVGQYGINNFGALNNGVNGKITIDNCTFTGLFTSSNTFTNAGEITIGKLSNVGENGIINVETLNNLACGTLSVFRGKYINPTGKITLNEGFIHVTDTLENNGTFTNNGVLKHGVLSGPNAIVSGTNASLIVNNSEPIFTYGGTYNGTIDGIYSDSLANTSAGTFTAPNAFTPANTLSTGSIILHAKITPSGGACSFVVPFYYDNPIISTTICSSVATSTDLMTWTGAKNTNWDDACNWSPLGIPTATNDVVIAPTSTQPSINVATAVAKSVEVQASATLSINGAGVLTINGSKSIDEYSTTAFYNKGTVQNNGKLTLGNLTSIGNYGIWNLASFTNNIGAEITIDRSISRGIYNETGTFTNVSKITIGSLDSSGELGLDNRAVFNNNDGGEIKIDRLSEVGLLSSQSTFTNSGKIIIGSSVSTGAIGLESDRTTFINGVTGQIKIDRTTEKGLSIEEDTFTNLGNITIGGLAGVGNTGMSIRDCIFDNITSGEIRIDNSTSEGLSISGVTLNNSGNITIGGTSIVGENGLLLAWGPSFNNSACGSIKLLRGNFEVSLNRKGGIKSALTNTGLIQINNELSNYGLFTNNGVLKYGTLTGTTAIVNATDSSVIVNNSPTPVFTYGGTYNGTINGIFTDSLATTSAGTFNSPNTFTPAGTLPSGTQILYAKITPSGGACSYIVPFNFNNVFPEINVIGNSVSIESGATATSVVNHTEFGMQNILTGSISRTFEIENIGTAPLTLTGTPKVVISGMDAADFSITAEPSTYIAEPNASAVNSFMTIQSVINSSTSFTVEFDPTTSGIKTATISIANDDSDENPYTFAISGEACNLAKPTIGGDSEICFGESTILSTDNSFAAGQATYLWSDNSTGSGLTVSPTSTSTYNVTITANGCTSPVSGDFVVTVNPKPIPPVLTADNMTICKGESAIVSASCEAGNILRWSTPVYNPQNTTQALGNSDNRVISTPGTYTAYCESDKGCLSDLTTIVISETANCTGTNFMSVTPLLPYICPGESVLLTSSGCTGTVTWVGPSVNQSGVSITVSPAASATYFLSCSNGSGTSVIVKVAAVNLAVSTNVTTGIDRFRATEALSSDRKVGSENYTPAPNVLYQAGKSIILQPGFETAKTATFKAEIKTCN